MRILCDPGRHPLAGQVVQPDGIDGLFLVHDWWGRVPGLVPDHPAAVAYVMREAAGLWEVPDPRPVYGHWASGPLAGRPDLLPGYVLHEATPIQSRRPGP
jgi:hypothetical protein